MSEPRGGHGLRAKGWITACAMWTYFLASAAVMFWFGLQDIFGETSYGVRLRAAAMIAASAYLLISAFAVGVVLFRGSVAASAVALIGGTLGALTGTILLVYQLVGGDYTQWIWAWLGMSLGGVVCTIRLLKAGARFPYPKQFGIALTVTTLIGAANFTYNSLYQPTAQPTRLGVEVNIAEPAFNSTGAIAAIPVSVSFVNSGEVGLHVVTAIFSVVGRRGSIANIEQTPGQMLGAIQNGRPASRWTVVGGYDLLQADEFVREGSVFEPGDRANVGRIVELPLPTSYDAIAINATVLVVRRDNVVITEDISRPTEYSWDLLSGRHLSDAPAWVADPGTDYVQYQVPINESSYLRDQTRKDWEGLVWRVLAAPSPSYPPGSYLRWRFAPKGSPLNVEPALAEKYDRKARERYGVAWGETGLYERSVHELKLPESPAAW